MTPVQQNQLTGIRTGDMVVVRTGNDRGKQGRVLVASPRTHRLIVEGVNLVTRHTRPTRRAPQGGRIQQPSAIHASNVQLICPSCSKPTRAINRGIGESRSLVCRRCGEAITRKAQA